MYHIFDPQILKNQSPFSPHHKNPHPNGQRPGDVLHFRKRCSRARSNCRLWKVKNLHRKSWDWYLPRNQLVWVSEFIPDFWLNHQQSFFRKKRWKMTWSACFPKIYIRHNKLSDAMFLRWFYGIWQRQRHVPFSNLSNFKAEILSGSFDSRHLSSTTAVHEGKAILYSQIFTWTAMQIFGFWARLSITNPHVLHPAAEACLSMLTGMNPIFVAFFSCLCEKKIIFVLLFQW